MKATDSVPAPCQFFDARKASPGSPWRSNVKLGSQSQVKEGFARRQDEEQMWVSASNVMESI